MLLLLLLLLLLTSTSSTSTTSTTSTSTTSTSSTARTTSTSSTSSTTITTPAFRGIVCFWAWCKFCDPPRNNMFLLKICLSWFLDDWKKGEVAGSQADLNQLTVLHRQPNWGIGRFPGSKLRWWANGLWSLPVRVEGECAARRARRRMRPRRLLMASRKETNLKKPARHRLLQHRWTWTYSQDTCLHRFRCEFSVTKKRLEIGAPRLHSVLAETRSAIYEWVKMQPRTFLEVW